MGQIALQIPISGLSNSTEDPKVAADLTAIQNVINGNLDATNIADSLAQTAGVNTSDQTVKGATNIAASQSTSSTSYTLLGTPDQVSGLVLPANGLIQVWYQATWQESANGVARAAIFLGGNQLQTAAPNILNGPGAQSAAMGGEAAPGTNLPLFSFPLGLASHGTGGTYSGDVTTGQAVGYAALASQMQFYIGNGSVQLQSSGGPCSIFAAAGTYAVSVRFKASSGSVTASNRKLWVRALSFA